MSDAIYDPLWQAASEADLPIGFHPYQAADLPGACLGLRLNELGLRNDAPIINEALAAINIDNIFFTQSISNPFDMMNTLAFTLAGGVCERFPKLKLVFLEANGGWIVSWLERLDHQYEMFPWDTPGLGMKPSEYFRRQCWISFDPDESLLAFSANSPLCGADRIVWASDYPHADAIFPGVTRELCDAIATLHPDQQADIAGRNALALYRLA